METECKTFASLFRECCMGACGRMALAHSQDGAHAAAQAQCDALYEDIAARLGPERRLINRFDAAKNALFALDDELFYQQGFQDCVYLLRWMGAL